MNAIFTVADVLNPVQRALRLTNADDLTLATQRIDHWHRMLCDLSDWPALRAVATPATTGVTLALPNAAGIVSVYGPVVPYWFVDRGDVPASDLLYRTLWSLGVPSRNGNGDLLFDVWDFNADTGAHAASTGISLSVVYWTRPSALSSGTDKLALPSTRALIVRTILDLVGLMDRKDVDVQSWRAELDPAMAELLTLNPVSQSMPLRMASGRTLTRGPLR